MPNPVVHFEVIGKDGAATQRFYSELFGWSIDNNNPMNYGIVAAQDGGIGGGVAGSPDGSSGHAIFYVQVPDLQATLDKAEKLGGKTIMPPMEIPDMVTFALMADHDGHVIGLVKG